MHHRLSFPRRLLARVLCMTLALVTLLFPPPSAAPSALSSASAASTLTVSFTVTTYQNRARAALKQINTLRTQAGLEPLTMTSDLEKTAIQRAAELFVLFDHSRPDMTDFDTAAHAYKSLNACEATAECIAAGYSSADALLDDWRSSMRRNLLDGDFTHAGIACVYVKDSYNEYYWALVLQRQPEDASLKAADASAKAGVSKSMKVEIAQGMYAHADSTHKSFELSVSDIKLKTTSTVSVYLYDKKGVKIGKCDNAGLTFKSSETSLFTVDENGSLKRKKDGTGTLSVKAPGLDRVTCTVTVGSTNGAVTASTIGDATPVLSVKENAQSTRLSVYLKGASGYVLYRATSKNGSYTKVDEKATTSRWNVTVYDSDLSRSYYFKVRAYKNAGGKRVYSEYSEAVKLEP